MRPMVKGDMSGAIARDGFHERNNAGRDEKNNVCYDVKTQSITCLSI